MIPDPIVDTMSVSEIIAGTLKVEQNSYQEGGESKENEEERTCSVAAASTDDVHVFAISATDGLMDYLKPIDVAKEIADSLFGDEQSRSSAKGTNHLFVAQSSLIVASAQGWYSEMKGEYRDDIAIAAAVLI